MRHHQLELGDLEDVQTSAVSEPLADAGRVLAAGLHRRLVARELDVTAVCAPSIALAVAMQKSALRTTWAARVSYAARRSAGR